MYGTGQVSDTCDATFRKTFHTSLTFRRRFTGFAQGSTVHTFRAAVSHVRAPFAQPQVSRVSHHRIHRRCFAHVSAFAAFRAHFAGAVAPPITQWIRPDGADYGSGYWVRLPPGVVWLLIFAHWHCSQFLFIYSVLDVCWMSHVFVGCHM